MFKKNNIPWNKGLKGYTNSGSFKKDAHAGIKTQFKKGHTTWNKGLKGYLAGEKNPMKLDVNRKKVSIALRGEKNHFWRGNLIGYNMLHIWVKNTLGKANCCNEIGCNKKSKRIEWANLSNTYLRDIQDWRQMCKSCHVKYDRALGWGTAKKVFNKYANRIT